ncbi:hypothetical protein J5N97_005500 [Dioscorea zingiberensis]|uniref:Pentatricopeptide repeat-containing protein n=1 Tax=Dioscorea zingiberensis TaxID=325984 RepID=A0A9D5D9V5_9LILI|nr:hypothetical protein J5N97_005500 [Dioscorea zingiberensis]
MAPRLLFPNLSRILCHLRKDTSFEIGSPWISSLATSTANFSTIPRRNRREIDPSEDQFLRGLNFGDDEDNQKDEKLHEKRPLRGDKRSELFRGEKRSAGAVDDFAEEFGKPDRTRGRSFDRRPDGAFRGEGTGEFGMNSEAPRRRFSNEFKFDGRLKDLNGKDERRDRSSGSSLLEKLNLDKDVVGDEKIEGAEKKPSVENLKTEPSVAETSVQDADEIFRKMKETGLIPNAVAMLDGLCKDGLIQDAMKLFGLMREKGTIPEVVIYSAVVEGFCKAAKFDDAKRIFRKMQKNGIVPNAFSYGVIIQGLCKGMRLDDSVEFCVEMLDAGHVPNPATFTGLVDALCKEKGMEEAENLVRRLRQEKGFPADDKAIREHMDKKGPFSPMVWEAIFGKKGSQKFF